MNASNFTCPQCGTQTHLRLPRPQAVCCLGCSNVYSIGKDGQVKDEQETYKMPEQISLVKMGTKGMYNGNSFEVIGRIRSVSNCTISNQWVIWFDKTGAYKWLVESNFLYFIYEPDSKSIDPNIAKNKLAGKALTINDEAFIIYEISKQATFCMEGQIPEEAFNPEKFYMIEFANRDNTKHGSINIYNHENADTSFGKMVKVADLSLSTTNEFKDWL